MAEEYELYLTERIANDRSFEEGALYAGKNALIYDSVQEEGNIYTVLKNSNKKYVDNFEVIKGELFYFSQNEKEKKWAQEIGIKVSPYIIIDGELMSSDRNLDLMDEATGSIVIPQNVTKIGAGAFRDVPGLRSIVIPGTVKEIGEHAFSGNPTLENVIIEEGVEKIGAYAFQSCLALKTIKIADSVSQIGELAFGKCTSLVEINFPKQLKEIPISMLDNCYKLKELDISEGITTINGFAFRSCTSLEKIKVPSTVTAIQGSAFIDDNKLINIEISANNRNFSFDSGSLMSKDGKTIYFVLANMDVIDIPETVESIDTGVFSSYPRNTVINVSKNVKKIHTTFNYTITAINVDEENPYFKSQDGNLYDKEMTIIYRYTQNKSSFTLPNTVKKIEHHAFASEWNLTQLILSENLEAICSWALSGINVPELYLPTKVNDINSQAFAGIDTRVTIAEDNQTYKTEDGILILSKDGKSVRTATQNLETYNIPDTVEYIYGGAFYYKTKLKELRLPSNIKYIGYYSFPNTKLSKLEIPASIEGIDANAFLECSSLKEIIIDKKEGSISGAPWGCPYGLRAVFWKK